MDARQPEIFRAELKVGIIMEIKWRLDMVGMNYLILMHSESELFARGVGVKSRTENIVFCENPK